jgi:heme exporter protein C
MMTVLKYSHLGSSKYRLIIYSLTCITLAVSSVLAFAVAPADRILGESSRLIYIHVPLASSAVLSFVLSGVYAALYLSKGGETRELRFHSAATLGTFFTVLTTITGAAWARVAWGTWWNWDPRETSILFLLAVYAAYFALYSSRKNGQGRLRASYLLFAAAVMPFFVFIAPRIYPSLHPDTIINTKKAIQLDGSMRAALFSSIASYALLNLSLFDLTVRTALLEKKQGVRK